jgi:hypothetical protein
MIHYKYLKYKQKYLQQKNLLEGSEAKQSESNIFYIYTLGIADWFQLPFNYRDSLLIN